MTATSSPRRAVRTVHCSVGDKDEEGSLLSTEISRRDLLQNAILAGAATGLSTGLPAQEALADAPAVAPAQAGTWTKLDIPYEGTFFGE